MVPHHLSRNKNVTDRELRLWLILHSYTKGKTSCSPSVPRLASDMGCSVRTVQRLLHQMEAKNLVKRDKRIGCETSYMPCLAADIKKPTPVTDVTPVTHVTGDTDVTSAVPNVTPTPVTHVTLREQVQNKKSSLPYSSSKNTPEKTVAPPAVGDDRALKVVKKPPPPKDPAPSKVLIDHWHDEYLAKRGEKPIINGGRDGAIFNRLLKTFPIEEVKRRITAYLDDPLEWMSLPNWSIPAFSTKIGAYVPGAVPRQPRPVRQERITKLPPNWMEIKE